MSPAECRAKHDFHQLERRIADESAQLARLRERLRKDYPLDDGRQWIMMANGKLSVQHVGCEEDQ